MLSYADKTTTAEMKTSGATSLEEGRSEAGLGLWLSDKVNACHSLNLGKSPSTAQKLKPQRWLLMQQA